MKKTTGIQIVLFMFLAGNVIAQQDPNYSQYMFNQLAINPAYAGINDVICLNGAYRNQWMNITGAPQTFIFSANAPVKPFGINSGVGLSVLSDNLGFQKNIGFNADYSYKLDLRKGKLGIGMNLGFLNSKFQATWVTPQTPESGDVLIPGTNESAFGFDLGFGVYYKNDDLYMGISTAHVLQPQIKFQKGYVQLPRQYNVLAGYRFVLPNPMIELRPSAYLETDGKLYNLTLNTNVVYNKRFWGGVSYRAGDAFIALLGVELFNGLKVGCSYDFGTSDLRHYSSGTTEIVLGYCFNVKVEKTPQKYKSVRIL